MDFYDSGYGDIINYEPQYDWSIEEARYFHEKLHKPIKQKDFLKQLINQYKNIIVIDDVLKEVLSNE